jgi:hypothetical protein
VRAITYHLKNRCQLGFTSWLGVTWVGTFGKGSLVITVMSPMRCWTFGKRLSLGTCGDNAVIGNVDTVILLII